MSDKFETVMQDIAIRSAANGGPTTSDVLTALQAAHSDDQTGRAELTRLITGVSKELSSHVRWTNEVSLPRLKAVEDKTAALDCIRAEHREFHDKHLATDHAPSPRRTGGGNVVDPPDADFHDVRAAEDVDLSDARRVMHTGKIILVGALASGLIFWIDTASRYFTHVVLGWPK